MRAHLCDRGQTKFEIDVVNLSASGFRAETSFTLWAGTVVWLTVPGLAALEAVVAWRDTYPLRLRVRETAAPDDVRAHRSFEPALTGSLAI